jgi:hypothetical protein
MWLQISCGCVLKYEHDSCYYYENFVTSDWNRTAWIPITKQKSTLPLYVDENNNMSKCHYMYMKTKVEHGTESLLR